MAHAITQARTKIFQASIDQAQTQEDWKTANVSPIFKKGDKPANYGPLSFTSMCYKVVEHILHSHLMNFFEYQVILTDYQQWFQWSCEFQLITTIQDLDMGIET